MTACEMFLSFENSKLLCCFNAKHEFFTAMLQRTAECSVISLSETLELWQHHISAHIEIKSQRLIKTLIKLEHLSHDQ